MAKISFTKLGIKTNQDIINFDWNGVNLDIKKYVPLSEKMKAIENIVTICLNKNLL
jgi:hypothetical protein